MLTQSLRGLERNGLIVRTLIDSRPLKVEYALTCRGQTLVPIAAELKRWSERNLHAIEKDQVAFDAGSGRKRAN